MGCCASGVPTCDHWNGEAGMVMCTGNCGQSGSIWGSGPYTRDSHACTAARHAGAIDEKGGTFKVSYTAGCDSYESTTANGITSGSYGAYGESMEITKTFFGK